MNGRERLLALAAGTTPDRPAFVPLLSGFVAGLLHRPVRDTFSDPGLLFRALVDAQRLLGHDAFVALPDRTFLAQSAGATIDWGGPWDEPRLVDRPWAKGVPSGATAAKASGRAGVIVEVHRRLCLAEPGVAHGLAVAGPVELATMLRGADLIDAVVAGDANAEDALDVAGALAVGLVRACGEIGLDLIVVLDDLLPLLAARSATAADIGWRPLTNLARFYGAPILLISRRGSTPIQAHDAAVARLAPWASFTDEVPTRTDAPLLTCIGPNADELRDSGGWAQRALDQAWASRGPGFIVSTAEPVPAGVAAERLLHLRRAIDACAASRTAT